MSAALSTAITVNQRMVCQLPGCCYLRHGLDPWCKAHTAPARLYGHPSAPPLKPSQWASQRAAVRALLDANADHPGLKQALSWMSLWVRKAAEVSTAYKGAEEVGRLVRHGVTPSALLVEVCAIAAWLDQHPHALPSDRARDFAISRAVFAMAPRPRRITRHASGRWGQVNRPTSYSPKPRLSALSHVGQHLRQSLAPFLANVLTSLEDQDQHRANALAAMRAPLRAPITY
jgi:hypothetical protein